MKLSRELERKVLELAGEESPKASPPSRHTAPVSAGVPVLSVTWWLPGLILRSEANIGGDLRARIARKNAVKATVRAALGLVPTFGWRFPVRVDLHRAGKRLLDDDNLAFAFKAVRDVVAEFVGIDDGNTKLVRWGYSQERVRQAEHQGIRITIAESGI